MFSKKMSKRKILLLAGDVFIIIVSLNLTFLVRFGRIFNLFASKKRVFVFSFLLLVFIISFYVFGLYNIKVKFLNRLGITFFVGANVFVLLLGMGWFYLVPFGIGRGIFLLSFVYICIFTFIWRVFFSSFFHLAIQKRNVLIIGEGARLGMSISLVEQNPEFRFVGFLNDLVPKINPGNHSFHLGKTDKLENVVQSHNVDDIVLTVEPEKNERLIRDLVNCRLKGIRIIDLPVLYEYLTDKLPINYIKDQWLLYCHGFEMIGSQVYIKLKKGFDFIVSFIGLILSFPLALVIVVLIKATSRGPLLYIQERLGEREKPFRMYKFRTMVFDAERGEPKWAKENDRRVTAVGKVLRKTRLDELPQLINVLKGEMSLVGPRPEREYFSRLLKEKIPYYSLRFVVKPGITGWAQVNYRYGSSVEDTVEKLCYDLYYIKNMSLFLDFGILLRTIRIILFGLGR